MPERNTASAANEKPRKVNILSRPCKKKCLSTFDDWGFGAVAACYLLRKLPISCSYTHWQHSKFKLNKTKSSAAGVECRRRAPTQRVDSCNKMDIHIYIRKV
eukprot:9482192-Pyramimonas_sp.AAC.2